VHRKYENAYNNFVGKPERNISLGGPRSRWESKIKIALKGTRFQKWIGFIWLRIISIGGLF
jgi:hypothetical protein